MPAFYDYLHSFMMSDGKRFILGSTCAAIAFYTSPLPFLPFSPFTFFPPESPPPLHWESNRIHALHAVSYLHEDTEKMRKTCVGTVRHSAPSLQSLKEWPSARRFDEPRTGDPPSKYTEKIYSWKSTE